MAVLRDYIRYGPSVVASDRRMGKAQRAQRGGPILSARRMTHAQRCFSSNDHLRTAGVAGHVPETCRMEDALNSGRLS